MGVQRTLKTQFTEKFIGHETGSFGQKNKPPLKIFKYFSCLSCFLTERPQYFFKPYFCSAFSKPKNTTFGMSTESRTISPQIFLQHNKTKHFSGSWLTAGENTEAIMMTECPKSDVHKIVLFIQLHPPWRGVNFEDFLPMFIIIFSSWGVKPKFADFSELWFDEATPRGHREKIRFSGEPVFLKRG